MSFQSLFRKFELAIQLKQYKENKELLDKYNKIMTRLRDSLKQSNLKYTFEPFPQGSYAMGTGIKPVNGDYDIDVGLVFNDIDYRQHDPVTVKGWVYSAVQKHTAKVEWRRPCITVYYQEGGEPRYHVDLAVLAKDPATPNGLRLAIGKQNATGDAQQWQPDDRRGFMEAVEQRFPGEDGVQFRRVIRCLKRWKDEHFVLDGRTAPTGICLTVAAHRWFQPRKVQGEYDDLGAISAVVSSMLGNFTQGQDSGGRAGPRLILPFPNAPKDDVCARMSNEQMVQFQGHLQKLKAWLDEARRTDKVAPLRSAFGEDFPEK